MPTKKKECNHEWQEFPIKIINKNWLWMLVCGKGVNQTIETKKKICEKCGTEIGADIRYE